MACAANGVVLIETKTGKFNQKAQISYDGYYGVQIAQNVLKMANAEQFTNMALESGSPSDAAAIANAMQRYGRSRVNPNGAQIKDKMDADRLEPAQRHFLDQVAFVLLQDEIGALARRQDIVVQIDQIDTLPDRGCHLHRVGVRQF